MLSLLNDLILWIFIKNGQLIPWLNCLMFFNLTYSSFQGPSFYNSFFFLTNKRTLCLLSSQFLRIVDPSIKKTFFFFNELYLVDMNTDSKTLIVLHYLFFIISQLLFHCWWSIPPFPGDCPINGRVMRMELNICSMGYA